MDNKNTDNIWSANDSVNNAKLAKGSNDNIELKTLGTTKSEKRHCVQHNINEI